MIVIDGHNDVLLALHLESWGGPGRTFFTRSEQGHIDLPRAREGGLAGGFFAIFTPAPAGSVLPTTVKSSNGDRSQALPPPVPQDYAHQHVNAVLERLFTLEAERPDALRVVRNVEELESTVSEQGGPLAVIAHLEGACAIDPELEALHAFYEQGVRSLGPVWSRPNAFGHGVPFACPGDPDTGPGLTEAGERLVRACGELGVMLDVSHLNAAGFRDVERLSQAPLVATHSAVWALCPSARNLTDWQLDAIAASRGVVGVNFYVGDLRRDGRSEPNTPIATWVRHVDYMVERMGVEHVAIGSDFDGCTVSSEIGDVSGLPRVLAALSERGYDEAALRHITHTNWLRVLRATWS